MKPKYEKKYKEPRATKRRRAANIAYLVTLTLAFEAIGLSLVVFPRSTESITEKRELKEFPEFTAEDYVSGKYTADISEWFSDTVPFRDDLTNMSTALRELRGFRQDGIRLHNVGTSQPESKPAVTTPATTTATTPKPDESEPDVTETVSAETATAESTTASEQQGNHEIDPVEQEVNEDDAVNITNNGIAVVGTRALMLYGGSFTVGESYAGVINKYKEALGDDVNVYSMIIPTSCEFYSPPSVAAYCGSELDNINHVIDNLRDDVLRLYP